METTPYTTWTAYTADGKVWEAKSLDKLKQDISEYCYGMGGDDEISLPVITDLIVTIEDAEKQANAAQLALFNEELCGYHPNTQLEAYYASDAASYERSLMGDRI